MKQAFSSSGFLDLSLVFALSAYNPQILTVKFLKTQGIIPNDWQLVQPEQSTARQIDLLFKNGVRITGQPGAIRFVESLVGKNLNSLLAPPVARQFAAVMSDLEYRAVGINPRRYGAFTESQNAAQDFINESLLTPKGWQAVGTQPVRTNIDLGFTLDHGLLRVNIQAAQLQRHNQEPVPAVLFMGNYHYAVRGDTSAKRLLSLNQALDALSQNLTGFQDLIDHQLLGLEPVQAAAQPEPPQSQPAAKPSLWSKFKRLSVQPSGA
jgi:hypothetical protein